MNRVSRLSPSLGVLQIFAREPIPGQVKTRLAQRLGPGAAADIYRSLLDYTLTVAQEARTHRIIDRVELWAAPSAHTRYLSDRASRWGFSLLRQRGMDLGQRMAHAIEDGLVRNGVALLVGSDCPVLSCHYLAQARRSLEQVEAVFGPTEDGGYALVGATRPLPCFTDIAWSTNTVLADTLRQLRDANVTYHQLGVVWDVDYAVDVHRWRGMACPPRDDLQAAEARSAGDGWRGSADMNPLREERQSVETRRPPFDETRDN